MSNEVSKKNSVYGGRLINYLQSLKDELAKVSWTTREELLLCTKIVVGATVFFGIGIYLADLLIKAALRSIEVLFRLIFG